MLQWTTWTLDLLVVAGSGPSLMERVWLGELKPDIKIHRSAIAGSLQKLLIQHAELFSNELGLIKGLKAKIQQPSLSSSSTVLFLIPSR